MVRAKKDTENVEAEPLGHESELTSIGPPEPDFREEPPKRSAASLPDVPTQSATAEYLCDIFNGTAWLLGSSTRFQTREFAGMAKSLHTLAGSIPALEILLRLLGPLTIVFQIVSKWRRIMDGRPRKTEPEAEPAPFVPEPAHHQPEETVPAAAPSPAGEAEPVMVVVPDLAPSDHPESPLVVARRYG